MYIVIMMCFFFFKQKTAYEMRISDWSSDVCSSDLLGRVGNHDRAFGTLDDLPRELGFLQVEQHEAGLCVDGGGGEDGMLHGELPHESDGLAPEGAGVVGAQLAARHEDAVVVAGRQHLRHGQRVGHHEEVVERKSVVKGKSVSVRVDLGVRGLIRK